jgi:hypothetical protein
LTLEDCLKLANGWFYLLDFLTIYNTKVAQLVRNNN